MKQSATKARGGRPRNPANTQLIAALIARQDQLTQRRRRQLAELRAQYVEASVVVAERIEAGRMLRDRMRQIPPAVAPQIATTSDSAAVFAILDAALRSALEDVADAYERSAAAVDGGPAMLATLRPSKTWAEARARAAEASTALAHFRDRIRASRGES